MPNYKCKMCGGELLPANNDSVTTCPYCFSKQTISKENDEKRIIMFNRANQLRKDCEFDMAILAYQSIINEFPNEAEAYWGMVLSRYGIEYVDDPVNGKKLPTLHRLSSKPITSDTDYYSAVKLSDCIAKEEYIAEAKQIASIQKEILEISNREKPYDIFICYKENDDLGNRSMDSVLAYDIYDRLKDKFKVFFARVSLEDKLGRQYEPYIYSALNSSKVMLLVATKKEHVTAVWVKNEWKRFLDLMKVNRDRYLIPCYHSMSPYDFPSEISTLQAQDLSKLGYMQDLSRGIEKLLGKENSQDREYSYEDRSSRYSSENERRHYQEEDEDIDIDPSLEKAGEILGKGVTKAGEVLGKGLNKAFTAFGKFFNKKGRDDD